MTESNTVWLVNCQIRGVVDTNVFSTEAKALAMSVIFLRDMWDKYDDAMPENTREAIEIFNKAGSNRANRWVFVFEREVDEDLLGWPAYESVHP